ncbi:glutathione S-transferase family protein [Rubrobacter aplysinae]|uniref:glutathione S-transferase family protein n=1 Tax=Rubrobacter aplysinae TaxID=909625 RepID=UPI001F2567B8|nr:glutathione S-transferase N-terminal domain-containing protein [Rubrobacter aplysinae]
MTHWETNRKGEEVMGMDLYYWPTPNGWKVSIMLEEVGADYDAVPVDIAAGDQFKKEFLEISPNNKMPALVDHDGFGGKDTALFESGAILIYLAEKYGTLYGDFKEERHVVNQWLMFQMGSVGPMLGQAHHFRQYAPERIEYAYERYTNEAARIYGVMDRHLENNEFFARRYSIADIAILPWIIPHDNQGQDLENYPSLGRWYENIKNREAVSRGLDLGKEWRKPTSEIDEETRRILFSNKIPESE